VLEIYNHNFSTTTSQPRHVNCHYTVLSCFQLWHGLSSQLTRYIFTVCDRSV